MAFVIVDETAEDKSNCIVYKVREGSLIGFEDYAYYLNTKGLEWENMKTIQEDKQEVLREFTVIASKKGQALELRISDLYSMTSEFPLLARMIYRDALRRLPKIIEAKKKVGNLLKKNRDSRLNSITTRVNTEEDSVVAIEPDQKSKCECLKSLICCRKKWYIHADEQDLDKEVISPTEQNLAIEHQFNSNEKSDR